MRAAAGGDPHRLNVRGSGLLQPAVRVSVIRSGESMENALRACCKGIRIGKSPHPPRGRCYGKQLIYEKLPTDITKRHVMLLDPILASGNSAIKAIETLIRRG